MHVSIWEQESFYDHKDVIIIGSGFAGLWTAVELMKKNPLLNVCLVDRGIIPTGASTRNAGFSCFGSLSELKSDSQTLGEENMLNLVKMRHAGLRKIRKYFKPSVIDYYEFGGYELFSRNGSYDTSNIEGDIKYINKLLRKTLKEEKVFRLSNKKIKKFGFRDVEQLVENPLEGQLHSGKLTQALVSEIQKSGAQILFGAEITGYEKVGSKIEVRTNQHFKLTTTNLIICTNAFTKTLLPELDVIPARGQVLVTSEIDDLKLEGTFHYEEGFYYFRNLGKRILLGGARNKFFEEENTDSFSTSSNIQNELENFLQKIILPERKDYQIDYRWSGIMGMGNEKMPIVKEVTPNVFCAVRMTGMGVALAPIIAEKVSKMVS